MLSKEEKEELLNLAHSSKLREDFRKLCERYRKFFTKRNKIDLDTYVGFLTFSNALVGHRRKTFKKIEGHNFKL